MSKVLDDALKKLNTSYGVGTVGKMKDQESIVVEKFSSGSLALDLALGGGMPAGRIIEIYGPESSGKTTLTLHALAEVQQSGKNVAFIDAEHAFDPTYAENLGIDTDELIMSQPDSGEQALEILDQLIRTNEVSLIVVDSVAALVPKSELDGEMGDSKLGLHARLMAQAMRKITAGAHKAGCTVIFINQLREKIGVMFGSPEVTTGGNSLKFYASQRIDIRRCGQVKDGDLVLANEVKMKIVKNKVARPHLIAYSQIVYGKGMSKVAEILALGVDFEVLERKGAWFSYNDNKLANGKAATQKMLQDNPELCDEIEMKIREQI